LGGKKLGLGGTKRVGGVKFKFTVVGWKKGGGGGGFGGGGGG